jgi:DNA-binding LacI/PurR family transcriptional regulator
MAVTIKDIAKEAGVSIAAVSKALNDRPGISLSLKRKITEIAQRLSYIPYIKARQTGMYAHPLKFITALYAYAGERLIRDIQNGINGILADSGFYELRHTVHTQLYAKERKQIFIDKILQDKGVKGVMSVFLKLSDAEIAGFQKADIPVVLLNNYCGCGKCVIIDNVEASSEATKALIELGRKNIGLIMPEETTEQVWEVRLKGYRKALEGANIGYNPHLINYEHSFDLKGSAYATKVLLDREPKIDAILYGSDMQAYGGMEVIKEMGKRIPEDIAVIGFDDMFFSKITTPPLTSVKQPMFEMGKEAAALLLEAIKKKDFSHKVVTLKSQLILRQSTHRDISREKLL